jgi:hypothetical protein
MCAHDAIKQHVELGLSELKKVADLRRAQPLDVA